MNSHSKPAYIKMHFFSVFIGYRSILNLGLNCLNTHIDDIFQIICTSRREQKKTTMIHQNDDWNYNQNYNLDCPVPGVEDLELKLESIIVVDSGCLALSIFESVLRCTSSGPSTSLSVRAAVHIAAKGWSADRPPEEGEGEREGVWEIEVGVGERKSGRGGRESMGV